MTPLVLIAEPDDARPGRATVTLDSPHNRNALSSRLVEELGSALDAAAADPAVQVVELRASGRSFCSGADLSEAAGGEGMSRAAGMLVDLQRRIVAHPKPVVARVHGAVRAGGIGIVAACDVAISAAEATYAFTEVRLALTPAVISLTVLPRLTDRAAALAFLTGEVFDGRRAQEIGLVTAAVHESDLDAEVDAVCAAIAEGHPQGLRETKALLAHDLLARIDRDGAELAALSGRLFTSDAARGAMAAFLSRRPSAGPRAPG